MDVNPVETPEPTKGDQPADDGLAASELRDAWSVLSAEDRIAGFKLLERSEAEDFFFNLSPEEQIDLLYRLPSGDRRSWVRLLAPDDAADLIQEAKEDQREILLNLLDEPTRKEVTALMAYAEDEAGGLMNPRFARVRPDMTVDEATSYIRKQAREHIESIYYIYVLDTQQHLLGVLSFREMFTAAADKKIRDIMHTDIVTAAVDMDQEALSLLFSKHSLMSIPIVDKEHRLKGIVTFDDIVDVVEEEATEDIHKLGGLEALDAPYLSIGLGRMIQKRGGWLSALFIGEMFTATALAFFNDEIAKATVLSLFMPLIISSGGNSGSQATSLVIRSMALGEVRLRDWWRVIRRELASGVALGTLLGVIGFIRINVWPNRATLYTEHYFMVSVTIATSLVGVVTFGTIAGSMLPFILRRLGLDPASASAPFVATLVDVTGLIIYFSVAKVLLAGILL